MAGQGGGADEARGLDEDRARRRRQLLESIREAAALRRRISPRQAQLERERSLVQAHTRRLWGEVRRSR